MSTASERNDEPVWQVYYQAALLEFEPRSLQRRIDEARTAIMERLARLSEKDNLTGEEHRGCWTRW